MWRATRVVLACVAFATALGPPRAAEKTDKPKDIGLLEKAGTRLVQIDLSVTKRDGSPVDIQPSDLEIRVGKRVIRDFSLDRICSPTAPSAPEGPNPTGARAIASYLFYFDEPHLTYAGRARGTEVARELVKTLIVGGNRGMVVSNGRDLLALSGLTDDPAELLAALDRLQNDTSRQESFAEEERNRVAEFLATAQEDARQAKEQNGAYRNVWSVAEEGINCQGGSDPLCSAPFAGSVDMENPLREKAAARTGSQFTQGAWRLVEATARGLRQDDLHLATAALERFRLALSRLAVAKPPKAVVFFADTLRRNAGEHYLRELLNAMRQEGLFSGAAPEFSRVGGIRDVGAFFDRAVAMAGTVGARVYAVQAQGMTESSEGLRDAKDLLWILAAETGGRAFLEGTKSSAVAGSIAEDMGCIHLVSFEPGTLPQDQSLPVRIALDRRDAIVRARSQIVIPSEKAMADSRRLAAFLDPRANGAALSLGLVPVGFDGKKYSQMFQVAVPSGGPAESAWTISASIVASGRVVQEFDRTLTAQQADQLLVVEHMVNLPPASYEVVAVAENTTLGVLHSGQFEVEVPEAGKGGASVTLPVALQPETGWFVRDDSRPRNTGPLVRVEGEPLKTDRPTALVAYVCRGKGEKKTLRIDRQLVGQSAVTFTPVVLEPEQEPCAQVRDMVPAATLGAGVFQYVVTVLRGDEVLGTTQREVVVAQSPTIAESPR